MCNCKELYVPKQFLNKYLKFIDATFLQQYINKHAREM